jgi:hypothetical protein
VEGNKCCRTSAHSRGENRRDSRYDLLVAGILVLAAPEPRCTWMTTMSYVAELERLANSLCRDVSRTSEFSMLPIAERMAKTLGVKPDGVAILGLSARWRHLYFLAPENLKNVGFIPLNSTSALAARTARESRPEIINNFASVRHACVFEAVKSAGEPGDQIQRIISAPVLCGETVVGVLQISRKGQTVVLSGPDFTPADLGKALALCRPLGKMLQVLTVE